MTVGSNFNRTPSSGQGLSVCSLLKQIMFPHAADVEHVGFWCTPNQLPVVHPLLSRLNRIFGFALRYS